MNTAITLRSLIALTLCATLASCTKEEPLQPNRPAGAAPTALMNEAQGLGAELTAANTGLTSTDVAVSNDTPVSSSLPNVAQQQVPGLSTEQGGTGGTGPGDPLEDPVRLHGEQDLPVE
ncbi:MAG TPA: hypothetical protein PKE21_06255 [Flavobacteriales bacterium]|nr:hypothetical protein [Flavobacteriales bacterium]HMR27061.1 hypothetical protein [Flavobacteriales bacterium]